MSETFNPLASIRHIIVDRDGTLNRELSDGWVRSVEEWEWLPGSIEALQLLASRGLRISVVTNQSGIGRGVVSESEVGAVHQHVERELAEHQVELVGIYVCPHAPDRGCACRKPAPGLVRRAIDEARVRPEATLLIGDDRRDLQAGEAAGTHVALVCTGKGSQFKNSVEPGTLVFRNLLEAAELVSGSAGDARSHGGS